MEVGKLTVQHRAATGKGISRVTRRGGEVPGVCYGHGLEVLELTIAGGEKPVTVQAMVWDFQISKLRREITHVDLKAIDPDKLVEAVVPVISEGTHAGLVDGGLLSWSRHEVKISAKPAAIPTKLVLDITALRLGDTLHVSDLPLPEGVTLADAGKLTIVTCIAPKGLKSDTTADAGEEAAAATEEAPKA